MPVDQLRYFLLLFTGVLQVEAMAQLAGIVMIDPEKSEQQENFFFGGIENCKFRKPVVPGDQLVRPSSSILQADLQPGQAHLIVSGCFVARPHLFQQIAPHSGT